MAGALVCSPPLEAADWRGCTLVVACAASANVGQLASDLLVETLALPLSRSLFSCLVESVAGNDALGRGGARGSLATSLQLFASPDRSAAVLQQRSPCLAGAQRAFSSELAAWARASGFARVVLLAGLDARLASDSQQGCAPLRCHTGDDAAGGGGGALAASLAAGVAPLESREWDGAPLGASRVPPWPQLAALRAAGVPCGALVLFVSDGDSSEHAAVLASAAARELGQPPRGAAGWAQPAAWAGVFGRLAPGAAGGGGQYDGGDDDDDDDGGGGSGGAF